MGEVYLLTNGIAGLGSTYGTSKESFKCSNVPDLYERTREIDLPRSSISGTLKKLKSRRSCLFFLYVNVVLQSEDLVDEITNPDARSTLPHASVRIFINDSNWNPILEEC